MKKLRLLTLLLFIAPNLLIAETDVILTFTQPKTRVDGTTMTPEEIANLSYKVYFGTESKKYTYTTELTMLKMLEDGRLENKRTVPFSPEDDLYVTITATDENGLTSEKSTEVIRKGKVKLLPPGIPEIIGKVTDEIIYAAFFNEKDIEIDKENKVVYMSKDLIIATENLYNNEYLIVGYLLDGEDYQVKVK